MGCGASSLSHDDGRGSSAALLKTNETLQRLGVDSNTLSTITHTLRLADVNGDGSFEISELGRIFSVPPSNMFLPQLGKLFDVNADGNVSLLEFFTVLSQFHDGSAEVHISFAWRLFDTDNTGYLDKNELMEMMKHIYTHSAGTLT